MHQESLHQERINKVLSSDDGLCFLFVLCFLGVYEQRHQKTTNVNDVSWRWAGFQICHMRLILPKLVRLAQTPSEVTGTCKMKGGFGVHCVCHLKRNEASTLLRKNQLRGHADTGTSHRIPSHHLTSHRTTSHGATSQHNTSHRVASHHITAHTTHHTAPHHIITEAQAK